MEATCVVLAIMREGKLLFVRYGGGRWILPLTLHTEKNDPSVAARKLLAQYFPNFKERRSATFKGIFPSARKDSLTPIPTPEGGAEKEGASIAHQDDRAMPLCLLVMNGEGDVADTRSLLHFETRFMSFSEYERADVHPSFRDIVDMFHEVHQLSPHGIEVTIF